MVLKTSIILHLSLGTVCYEYPSRNSSVPITVNCTFPENLCFKYDNTTASGEQVTIQGCISADQCQQFEDQHLHCCEGHLCNSSKYDGHKKVKKFSIYARLAMFRRNREKLDYLTKIREGRKAMLSSEVDLKTLSVIFRKLMHLFYSAHSRTFPMPIYYNAIPLVSVMNTTMSEAGNPTRAISKVIYISVGVTSAFLLLSVAFFVWCYRRKKLKTIERLV